jgi:hypothetical protein
VTDRDLLGFIVFVTVVTILVTAVAFWFFIRWARSEKREHRRQIEIELAEAVREGRESQKGDR